MDWTRSQLENFSKEEPIEEIITVDDVSSKLSDLPNWFFEEILKWFFEEIRSCFIRLRYYNKL